MLLFFFIDDSDRTLAEYEYGSINNSEDYLSISKQQNENILNGSTSLRCK